MDVIVKLPKFLVANKFIFKIFAEFKKASLWAQNKLTFRNCALQISFSNDVHEIREMNLQKDARISSFESSVSGCGAIIENQSKIYKHRKKQWANFRSLILRKSVKSSNISNGLCSFSTLQRSSKISHSFQTILVWQTHRSFNTCNLPVTTTQPAHMSCGNRQPITRRFFYWNITPKGPLTRGNALQQNFPLQIWGRIKATTIDRSLIKLVVLEAQKCWELDGFMVCK